MKEIETLESKIVYRNHWMSVREDKIKRQSGTSGIFGVVEKPDFAAILAIEDEYIYLVEQYRYAVEERYWEIPQGAWENKPDSDPLKLAAGELKEETGLKASRIQHVGFQYLAYGYSTQGYNIYLATELSQSTAELDTEEEGLICKKFPLKTFENMILNDHIKDATTVNAYGLAKLKGML